MRLYLRKPVVFSALILLALVVSVGPAVVSAQSGPILQLAVPQFLRQSLEGGALDAFEAQNGVQVNLVITGNVGGSPVNDVDGYLETVGEYVTSADVVFVQSNLITPEATRAGLFLDLAPLTSGDPNLNPTDFIPAVWQSFQWDGGVWALPFSTNVVGLSYDAADFDAAGLAYPMSSWTIDDLANAARALAVRGPDGAVTTAGLAIAANNVGLLYRSLTGQLFYDPNTLPANPRLATPELAAFLDTWKTLLDEGVVVMGGGGGADIPSMNVGGNGGGFGGPNANERAIILLPGGTAGLTPSSFAVSAGTQYPELAYELAKFLTMQPELANGFLGVTPARQSLAGIAPTNGGGPGLGGFVSPATQAFVADAIAYALPVSETRFANYVGAALNSMTSQGLDGLSALQQVEATAITNLQTADTARGTTVVAVATPVPPVVLQAGEVSIRLGVGQPQLLIANREAWSAVASEFAANDPQVGDVILDTPAGFGPGGSGDAGMAESFDCFYLNSNSVPSLDLSLVLNLDPFMDTDATFSRTDLVGNALTQVQRDNRTWAFPIMIQPEVLRYDPNQFAAAGVPNPVGGWTLDAFIDALEALKINTGDAAPIALNDGFSSMNLLMLIASYGGLPFDYRTDPPTVNFTDPATVDAIRQVLDLAKNGLIDYSELGAFGGGTTVTAAADNPPILTQTLGAGGGPGGGGGGLFGSGGQQNNQDYLLTMYPSGSLYTPISYNLGTAYISATAQNPDACYRLISTLSQHPELFGATMPARRSLINSPAVAAAQGQDAVDAYNMIDTLMQSPNTVVFPSLFQNVGPLTADTFLTQIWLNRAFDNYVLNDADLATELADAQVFVEGFQGCTAALPPFDPVVQSPQEYFLQFITCATQIDPSLTEFFGAAVGG
ncbi:MAG: extracellular solute-binding protein [Burkholderiales bacterium]|nr:extracellular solute-binding protein [Anaerolineae bacterium]